MASQTTGWSFSLAFLANILAIVATLQAQSPDPPELLEPEVETVESILQEKVNALQQLYDGAVLRSKVMGIGTPVDVAHAGCDLSLAKAELASAMGKPDQQLKHLKEAVDFANQTVKLFESQLDVGFLSNPDLLSRAIVRRADVKLALLRAKKLHSPERARQ
jgi:outer membrane protein TolC